MVKATDRDRLADTLLTNKPACLYDSRLLRKDELGSKKRKVMGDRGWLIKVFESSEV